MANAQTFDVGDVGGEARGNGRRARIERRRRRAPIFCRECAKELKPDEKLRCGERPTHQRKIKARLRAAFGVFPDWPCDSNVGCSWIGCQSPTLAAVHTTGLVHRCVAYEP
jgi:hypothetical protein